MAIIKRARNINIKVQENDTIIISGRYTQTADIIIIESLEKDVTLASAKKICSTGNK